MPTKGPVEAIELEILNRLFEENATPNKPVSISTGSVTEWIKTKPSISAPYQAQHVIAEILAGMIDRKDVLVSDATRAQAHARPTKPDSFTGTMPPTPSPEPDILRQHLLDNGHLDCIVSLSGLELRDRLL